MSLLSDILDWFRPKPKPPIPPKPPQTYTVRVEVFDGPIQDDEKIPGALVTLAGHPTATTDGAGNAHIDGVLAGTYGVEVRADGFLPVDSAINVPGSVLQIVLEQDIPPMVKLTTDGRIFREHGQPWRYKAVSAFRLLDRFASGDDIDPFLAAYKGFNTLRVFGYTPVKEWGNDAWDWPRTEDLFAFIEFCGERGWRVELVLLTDDDKARLTQAANILTALTPRQYPNLLIEVGNEPQTHKNILTGMLQPLCVASGYPCCSGDYENSDLWFGTYYTCHTARTTDWTRRAKDLREFYDGTGPDKPTHPHHVPCLGDEPGKWQDVGSRLTEWRAYFGNCALMGGGACFHSETGKLAALPTAQETPLIAEALDALDTFPADACLGAYRRIVEPGNEPGGPTENSRTYVVGNYAVRCQQRGTAFPEPGWTALDEWGILWTR